MARCELLSGSKWLHECTKRCFRGDCRSTLGRRTRILQLQLYLGFAGVAGRMDRALSTEELDVYIDCYGYLPESLAENMLALGDMYPERRHVLIYQLLIVDGIPEAQRPLQISLAKWDKVLIVSYQSPSPLLVRPKMTIS